MTSWEIFDEYNNSFSNTIHIVSYNSKEQGSGSVLLDKFVITFLTKQTKFVEKFVKISSRRNCSGRSQEWFCSPTKIAIISSFDPLEIRRDLQSLQGGGGALLQNWDFYARWIYNSLNKEQLHIKNTSTYTVNVRYTMVHLSDFIITMPNWMSPI